MKCKLNECIQHKIDVSIYLFFCWFYYFEVTRIRETMYFKLKIVWGGLKVGKYAFGTDPLALPMPRDIGIAKGIFFMRDTGSHRRVFAISASLFDLI